MASTVIDKVDRVFAGPLLGGAAAGAPPALDGADASALTTERGRFPLLDAFIDCERDARLAKPVSWRQLELCFKWMRMREYLLEQGLADDDPRMAELRALLQGNKLGDVEYDARERKVLRVGHAGL